MTATGQACVRYFLRKKMIMLMLALSAPMSVPFYFLNSVQKDLPVNSRNYLSQNPVSLAPLRFSTTSFNKKQGAVKISFNGFDANGEKIGGLARLPFSPGESHQPQILRKKNQVYSDHQVVYLGKLPGWNDEFFGLIAKDEELRRNLTLARIDKNGNFILVSSLNFEKPIQHLKALNTAHFLEVVVTLVDDNLFYPFSLNEKGETQALRSLRSQYTIPKVLLGLDTRTLLSIENDEIRVHRFDRVNDEETVLLERTVKSPEFCHADLAQIVPMKESAAIIVHDQETRAVQALYFDGLSAQIKKVDNIDNDEKWDSILGVPGSDRVVFYKKAAPFHSDHITVVAKQETGWRAQQSFSSEFSIDQMEVLPTDIIKDEQFFALGHEKNPIRVLQSTLEFTDSEVGGIAAVTKTLVPKLNSSSRGESVLASVIMPRFTFLKRPKDELCIMQIEHYFNHAWVKSCIYDSNDGLFTVEPIGDAYAQIFNVSAKGALYTDDEKFLPIERWLYFNSAVAAFVSQYKEKNSGQPFHVLHMHSYHAGVTTELLEKYDEVRASLGIEKPKTIFQMHALSYDQGWIKGSLLDGLGLRTNQEWENLTKRIFDVVDYVITVSEAMLESGLSDDNSLSFGLSDCFKKLAEENRVFPVLNGINVARWSPQRLALTSSSRGLGFDFSNVSYGKVRLKKHLKELGLISDENRPLVTFVGRFSDEKGIEHLFPALQEIVRLGGNFAIMGSYSKSHNCRQMIQKIKERQGDYEGRLILLDSLALQRKDSLGNLIRAASDFSFVPSREETCGLVPLEFFTMGALTITSYVGGLKDTVVPFNKDKANFNGFVFDYNDPDQLYWTLREAIGFVKDFPEEFAELQSTVMKESGKYDWSTEGGAVAKMKAIYKRAVQF